MAIHQLISPFKITDMKQEKNESDKDYLKRLQVEGARLLANLKQIEEDKRRRSIIGFCSECGCNRYADKEHKCEKY